MNVAIRIFNYLSWLSVVLKQLDSKFIISPYFPGLSLFLAARVCLNTAGIYRKIRLVCLESFLFLRR